MLINCFIILLLLLYYKLARSLRSNFQDLPIQPTCKTKTYGDRAFSVCAPKIWNTVPLEIRQSSTVLSFKKKLKTFLFTRFIENNSLSYFLSFLEYNNIVVLGIIL